MMTHSPDFISNQESAVEPQAPRDPLPHQPKRRGRIIAGAIFFLAIVIGFFLYEASRLAWQGMRLRHAAGSVQADFARRDFSAAVKDLAAAEEALERLQAQWRETGGLQFVPYLGTQWRAVSLAMSSGAEAVRGVKELAVAAKAIATAYADAVQAPLGTGVAAHRSFRDLSADEKRSILARFDEQLSGLRAARHRMDMASDAWDRVPQDQLAAPLRRWLLPMARALPALKQRLNEAVLLAEIAVPFSGYPKPKTFLLLLQNAEELRPAGGFIGTIGLLTVDAGDIKRLEFQDIYAIDGLVASSWKDVPPDPMLKYLGVKAWFLRDRNWSPDFSVSGEQVIQTFEREVAAGRSRSSDPRLPSIDGVIAFEPKFFEGLLKLTGPITVEGKTFSSENFFTELEYDVEQGFLAKGVPVRQRKDIVLKVGDELIERVTTLPSSRWPDLLHLLSGALEKKDLLVYARDPHLLALLDARDWSGRTKAAAGMDYLEVVDANLAALKTDGVMDKNIRYDLDLTSPEGPLATVTLTYTNTNRTFDWRRTRYRDYVRVYVPEGSQLISSEGAMENDRLVARGVVIPGTVDVMRDLGKTVFGAFWSIEPGETRRLKFRYRLPVSGERFHDPYTLLVQKQPGSNTRLTLDVLLGKKVQSAEPSEDVSEHGDDRYRVNEWPLEKDQLFYVREKNRD